MVRRGAGERAVLRRAVVRRVEVGGLELGLLPDEGGSPRSSTGVIAYWGVDDAEAALARLLELGATGSGGVRTWGRASGSPPFSTRPATSSASSRTRTSRSRARRGYAGPSTLPRSATLHGCRTTPFKNPWGTNADRDHRFELPGRRGDHRLLLAPRRRLRGARRDRTNDLPRLPHGGLEGPRGLLR